MSQTLSASTLLAVPLAPLAGAVLAGIFGTTLGPGSDGYHEDHMHFDTAHQRGGAYCR